MCIYGNALDTCISFTYRKTDNRLLIAKLSTGEEDDTITKDGDIQITPFNMKEEMTEGHFDAEGNYFWKKEVEIRDAWLDNIDDTKVSIFFHRCWAF